ncbi:uncharacterized protein LOC123913108 isoform X1 [Trifolium pratense]|uniref:Uncharacterized protein n=1 Tax=Trifolium pratense TaxID=57577 RepID=A0ACB0MEM5_TRIPR|nr:uncharacterized protein LOC123913108 isoform X1 [Trifolium pratense]XP_045819672.1 uncharacterized protein LOC123913108 isoform X1 [Trifolium pratense]CAJ2679175.1 unnamed protein product [Trifolium pratense]
MVDIPLFTTDDDIPDSGLGQANAGGQQFSDNLTLLSVDDILGSVLETTNHVGRISVSTPCNMPYKEMACHYENLLSGKQQKIFTFTSTHSLYGTPFRIPAPEYNNNKDESTNSNVQQSFPLSGNTFLDSNISSTSPGTLPETGLRLCATEYQHQASFFQLPASHP